MTKLEDKIAIIRVITRSFLVSFLLAILAYVVTVLPVELIDKDTRIFVLGALCGSFGTAMAFYFKKAEEFKEVAQNENNEEPSV